jgi:hypothetical protein
MSGDAGDELAEGILGTTNYEAPTPSKKAFLPWHKPRKQYVRDEQWCAEIEKMLDDGAGLMLGEKVLTYCGLPGSDLLDLRRFHEIICAPKSLGLRFLGFNSAAAPDSKDQIELNISFDEIMKLDFVDKASEVIQDDFRTIADTKSMGYGKFAQFGPFDVVNLDLCDSFGAAQAGLFNDNYYNAMQQAMAIQARRKMPWLLLLTTRVGKNHVHVDTLDKFRDRYAKNLKDCKSFRDESTTAFNIGDEKTLAAALSTASGLHCVFLTGICKWLLALSIGHKSSLDVRSVLGYRVVKGAAMTDLVSLAVRFTPLAIPATDAMNLSKVTVTFPDECTMSVDALKSVAAHRDVDDLLAKDKVLRDLVTANMAALLEQARYDPNAFASWAAQT